MKILPKFKQILTATLGVIITLIACGVLIALSPLICVILLISLFNSKSDEYIDEYTE